MRKASKVDGNQKKLVSNLRAIGCKVLHTHQLKNCFDLLVGYKRKLYMFEVKDMAQSISTRNLTEGESKFHYEWREYEIHVVHNLDECMAIFNRN